MTLAEILQAIEARLAQLQIVGRPLTDAEDAEVVALQRMIDASPEPTRSSIDGIRCAWDPREIKLLGKISTQRDVLGVGECGKCGTTWLATESLPCPNGCEATDEVRFFGDPLGLSSLQPDEPERPPSRGKGYYARAYGRTVGPCEAPELAYNELYCLLLDRHVPIGERFAYEHWYSPE